MLPPRQCRGDRHHPYRVRSGWVRQRRPKDRTACHCRLPAMRRRPARRASVLLTVLNAVAAAKARAACTCASADHAASGWADRAASGWFACARYRGERFDLTVVLGSGHVVFRSIGGPDYRRPAGAGDSRAAAQIGRRATAWSPVGNAHGFRALEHSRPASFVARGRTAEDLQPWGRPPGLAGPRHSGMRLRSGLMGMAAEVPFA